MAVSSGDNSGWITVVDKKQKKTTTNGNGAAPAAATKQTEEAKRSPAAEKKKPANDKQAKQQPQQPAQAQAQAQAAAPAQPKPQPAQQENIHVITIPTGKFDIDQFVNSVLKPSNLQSAQSATTSSAPAKEATVVIGSKAPAQAPIDEDDDWIPANPKAGKRVCHISFTKFLNHTSEHCFVLSFS